jgi:SAM-dependent MidA family methyltransferase
MRPSPDPRVTQAPIEPLAPDHTTLERGSSERLDHFMARANALYYASHNPFTDFTTSPQISQIFGEILGLWCGVVWRTMGEPAPINLIEAGPGDGALMADALRAIRAMLPAMLPALNVHFIETSPRFSAQLRARFPQAQLHATLDRVPDGPILLLANEFLDALPIRQFIRTASPDAWQERYVRAGALHDQPITQAEHSLLAPLTAHTQPGAIREINGAARAFTAALARRLVKHGGAALLIDYGPLDSGPGDTLQAIRAGIRADPLANPGEADLTAHVDFAALRACAIAQGCATAGPIAQGKFLSALGIHERTAALGRNATAPQAAALLAATRRLTAAEAMGGLFKALALAPADLLPLPGFPA